MKVYTCTGFEGYWPVGTSAVVVAESSERAAEVLEEALKQKGLSQMVKARDMELLEVHFEHAVILQDGDY